MLIVTIEPFEKGLYTSLAGKLNRTVLHELNRVLWEHPSWDDALYTIVDMSEVSEVDLAEFDLAVQAGMAKAGAKSSVISKSATVATHPDVIRIFYLWQRSLQPDLFEARIFGDLAAAKAWCTTARRRSPIRA